MHLLKRKALHFAALLVVSAPLTGFANDLSLPLYSWSQSAALDKPYDPNDPVAQLLSMEAVDVWDRIRKGFGIPDLDNPLVANQ